MNFLIYAQVTKLTYSDMAFAKYLPLSQKQNQGKNKEIKMMKKRKKSILILAAIVAFLINGCGAKEIKYVDVTHIFTPYEQATEISLQMPEDWKYTIWDVGAESPDWGYSIEIPGMADAGFRIWGQFGALTADGYSNGPEYFQTLKGLTGQYSWDEYTLDDKNPAVQGMIVFDTELSGFYGASFNMPKSIYIENKDIIDKAFQSIVIKEAY